MIKNILAVILGLIIGNIAIMSLHYLGLYFYPLPEGADMSDMTAIAEYVKIAPLGSLLMVMLAHIGGTFIAGVSITLLSKEIVVAYIVGGFFTISGIWNLYLLPHPMWFNIEVVLYLPAAVFGFKLFTKKS